MHPNVPQKLIDVIHKTLGWQTDVCIKNTVNPSVLLRIMLNL